MTLEASSKIVLVTGANQGLGLAVIQSSALRYPRNVYILCSRSVDKGNAAIAKLREAGVTAQIDLLQLEVTDDEDIAAAVKHVKTRHGRLDVLVNNAGFVKLGHKDTKLAAMRATYNEYMNVHVTSVAVLTFALTPLLHKSVLGPRVINVTSGLASMTRMLTPKNMARVPPYGTSKIGMNGLTTNLQMEENERDEALGSRIRFFISNPGLLKTAFSNFVSVGKEPLEGAESIVRLIGDDEGKYDGGMQWEFEEGEMRVVPW